MKKAVLGLTIFIFTLILSFLWHFPTESLVRYYLADLEKNAGITVLYSGGKFALNRVELENVEVLRKNNLLFEFSSVDALYKPFKLEVKAVRNGGNVKITNESDRTVINANKFPIIKDGKDYFKNIAVSGSFQYRQKRKTGTGKVRLLLKDSVSPLIRTDVDAECAVRLEPREIIIDVTSLRGRSLNGKGNINIAIHEKNFNKSPLSGELNINSGGQQMTLQIKGTVGKPDASPVFGGGGGGKRPF